jgi:hypothetical protein
MTAEQYVRTVAVAQAQSDLGMPGKLSIELSSDEQLAFWTALNQAPRLTRSQKRLGKIMQGKS